MKKCFYFAVYFAAVLLFYSFCPVFGQSAGMVVKTENGLIIINKGLQDGLKEGQEIYIKRINLPIAKVKISKIADYYAGVEIISCEAGQEIKPGDQISFTPLGRVSSASASASERVSSPRTSSPKQLSREVGPTPEQLAKRAAEDAQKRREAISKEYVGTLDKHTKSVSFSNSKGTRMLPGLGNLTSGYALYTIMQGARGRMSMLNPFMVLSLAKSTFSDQQKPQRAARMGASVNVSVVYYSPELINSQARFFASKDGAETDSAQVRAIADGITQQVGSDLYTVFQVKVENTSTNALQLAPFKWKMSLITENGEQVKALKYDEALDKTLGPGQISQGFMYFPKTDSAGNNIDNLNIKVKLESILNKKAEIKWN